MSRRASRSALLRLFSVSGATVLALSLSACGESSGASTAPTDPNPTATSAPAEPTPTPEQVASPTPTAPSRDEAAARYLELASASNEVLVGLSDAFQAEDLPELRKQATLYADALRTFCDGLIAYAWPDDVQPAVDALIADVSDNVVMLRSLATTTSEDETWAVWNTYTPTGSPQQEVRTRLGLDDVPVVD